MSTQPTTKVSVATVWLDGCSVCHMSFLDMDERLIELASAIDIVYSPLVDTKEFPEQVDLTLVEGSVSAEKRDTMLAMLPEARETTLRTLDWFKHSLSEYHEEIASFANFPSLFMGQVNDAHEMDTYDGFWRIIADRLDPLQYQTYIEEKIENWTYLKSPFYKPLGQQEGIYRVGPLARLLISERYGTPEADREREEFLSTYGDARTSSFFYHYARLIEILHTCESMEKLLNEPDILNPHVRARAEPNQLEGIGVADAPRGTLIHHYTIDDNGLIRSANLIIATGHNNLAMNRGVLQVAQHFIKGTHITDGMLNRMEARDPRFRSMLELLRTRTGRNATTCASLQRFWSHCR